MRKKIFGILICLVTIACIARFGLNKTVVDEVIQEEVVDDMPVENTEPSPVVKAFNSKAVEVVKISPRPFYGNVSIEETGNDNIPGNTFFWLNSGGRINIVNDVAYTLQGDLVSSDRWYKLYLKSNPLDTDKGLHPQNLLRLITLSTWTDSTQEMSVNLKKYNVSASPNRNASNGVLFFSRLKDSNNLYYAGIRVDGTVVIKKKKKGVYYTLAQKAILSGVYDLNKNPNLIPLNTWIGMKLITKNKDNAVLLTLYVDLGKGSGYEKVLETADTGLQGGEPFLGKGKGGIRGDFLDLVMKNYTISVLR